ncbi:alpha/beta-hydrolase [Clavulina sp. PMI_390]|nr:alpha/beta-hydrolase [Clavulina sp. PMI_390]
MLSYLKTWEQISNAPTQPPVTTVTPPTPSDTSSGHNRWKKGVFDGHVYNYLYIPPSQPDKRVFLLLHGFPNGPVNWIHFAPELTTKGHGILVPELLGYGETDKPTNVEAYAFKKLCYQLTQMMDAEGVDKVVVIGHDFGGPLTARFSQFYPERVLGIVLGGAPYSPPSPKPLDVDGALAKVKPVLGYENIGYFKYFPLERAPDELTKHIDSFISIMFGPPEDWKERLCKSGGLEESLLEDHISPVDPWFGDQSKWELVEYLRKGGMEGPCMWFRAAVSPVNEGDFGKINSRITHPFLYISPSLDPTYPLPLASQQDALCDDITTKVVETGHWIYMQDPKGAAEHVFDWGATKGLF